MELSFPSLIVEYSIESLIEEIEKRPALYKKSLKEYSDVKLKKLLWVEVCEAVVPGWNQLGSQDKFKQGQDLQKKWANLRTCFRRELNAQRNTKHKKTKRRNYVYFDNLLFLLPYMQNRQTSSNLEGDDIKNFEDFGPSTSTSHPGRKKKTHSIKQMDLHEAIVTPLNETNAVDEDTNFALSLVPSLQKLTVDEKLEAKICILNVFRQIILRRHTPTNSE